MSIITAPAPVVNANTSRHGLRAPKGGCTVNGRVFKGGQFCLPYDPANPHGLKVEAAAAETARVSIQGFVYTVAEIPAGECGSVAFRMHKVDTNNTYDVILNHFGEVTCDCPDYEARRVNTGTMCKHGRTLVELGMIPATTPTVLPPFARREPTPEVIAAGPRPTWRPRFSPTPGEMREAAQMFGDLTADRIVRRREMACR